ncbi:MAG TPA: hypothetical protein VH988_16475 [Thermoanaerobaculia bacterium]|nr:hypothetical protein [Thermoanaerobaculia bacterium]
MNRRSCSLPILLLLIGMIALLPGSVTAQVAKEGHSSFDGLAYRSARVFATDELETIDNVQGLLKSDAANSWATFRQNAGEWNALIDKRTGHVEVAEGAGIPWIPGTGVGNHLDKAAFPKVDLATLDKIARGFMPRVAGLLGINPADLVINKGRSGQQADYLWFVDYDVLAEGKAVEGARVVFRVNHGNLIQFGTENMPAQGSKLPAKTIKRETALASVARYIGGFTAADSFRDTGSLHVMSLGQVDNRFAEGFQFGSGRGLGRVWDFTFHRDGVMGTWRARVDAATGEVLHFEDVNEYVSAQATGGIYQNSPATGSEIVRPMPFANAGTGVFTNSGGIYNNTAAVTSTLSGQFVKITDTCGAISQASDGSGNLIFGTSTGTDCTTPGHGGAGNTHASREQFYHVNRIKEVVKGWLPTNTWLTGVLTVNVNLNQTCNAYWDGTALNFFKSGGGCSNTGEISGVSLHEFGHGIDQNDGTGTAPEGGTGESYGDTTAVIALHNSCLGAGFLSSNCSGYGNACTSCTGVRDVDYAKHSSGVPATVSNHTQALCPTGSGPCGKEVHCESYVPSEAIWDFANRDLPNPGTGPAWTTLDRLWYLSRNTATSSFTCHATGTFTSDGCGTGSWWKTMRAVDDDDGNLANGTPHGGSLFAAFNRHGIACTTDAGASTSFAGCAAPAAPTVTATPGNNSVGLSWSGSSGVYDVFRNETGCNAGFTKIANDNTTTSFTDSAVANGLTYFYQVIAQPSGNEACGSIPSTCVSVTPTATSTPDFTISASPATLSVNQGSAGTSTVTTAVSGGFNAAIALTASGQPTGVTVGFSPASIAAPGAGTSTATFTVASTTATGVYPITITGTSGSTVHSTTVTLTVTAPGTPDFTLTVSPAALSVAQGGTGTSTATTAVSGGFNAAIALTASGQPTGVTVGFSPSSIAAPGSGSSTITFTVASTTAVGVYPITITGTGGTKTHTATVTLTVTTSVVTQLLLNPGFESGAVNWTATAGVIDNSTGEPARTGSWKAWLDGYGASHTDSIYQQVTIPSTAVTATLNFYLHIDTAETTTTTQFDTLKVQIRNSSNTVLATLQTFSNLDHNTGFALHSYNLAPYIGQTIRVYFLGVEDISLQTSFVIDDTALNVN